jgi:sulfofructose kinase
MAREDIQVVGLGQACVDYLGRLAFFPHEDQKTELLEVHRQCGGPASTAMVTLARLGVETAFIGSVSDDAFGVQIVEGLNKEKVDFSHLKITPGFTSQFAFIAIQKETGARTIFWHRGSVPHLKPRDVDLSSFSRAKILHLDGLMIEASIEAARQARKMGMSVVMDAGTMREGSIKLVSLVDILIASERFASERFASERFASERFASETFVSETFVSETFAEPLVETNAHEKALKALHELGPKTVIITLGPRGSIGWDGGRTLFQNAFPIKALDTTGAGDVYHGAYIYGLLQKWSTSECMRFASATAALKCRAIGARKGIPGLKEVMEFMRQHRET